MKIDRGISTDLEVAAEQVKAAAKSIKEAPVEFINTGSIGLNLAVSGKGRDGGWPRGRIINLVGDGSSGKTLLALEFCAYVYHRMMGKESDLFPKVKKIRIVYDNGEMVMDFPVASMYGKDFADHIEWEHSKYVEQFGRRFTRECQEIKEGTLVMYVLDSLDSLTSEAGLERFEEAAKKDKAEDGSYGVEKPKYLSASFFANITSLMAGKDITLIIISQIRSKIGVTFGEKYSRAGGKAMDFYTHCVVWLAEVEKLKKTFRGEERVYGIRTLAKVKRSKVWKPFREMELIILFDYGIDDIGTTISYLWGPKVKLLEWNGQEFKREDLVKHIEENNLQDELAEKVENWWDEIEENLKPDRISKY